MPSGNSLRVFFSICAAALRVHQAGRALRDERFEIDAIDDVDRIEHVALALRHLLAFGVAHEAVHIDGVERHLAGEVRGHHHHPGDPEEDDVEARHEHGRRQERLQFLRLVRPAERRERHERGREPRVEHVFVALERAGVALRVGFGAGFFFGLRDEDLAVLAVPRGNLMAPPQLTRDAPVLDVFEPLIVGGGPVLRHEPDLAVAHDIERRFRDRLARIERAFGRGLAHRDEPLVREHRLDRRRRVRSPRGTISLCGLTDSSRPSASRSFDDLLARVEAVHAAILLGRVVVDLRVEREDLDLRQLVALADGVVVEIVRGRDLHDARAEFAVDVIVGDDRNFAVAQRQHDRLADQMLDSARLPDAPSRRRRRAWFRGASSRRSDGPSRPAADTGCATGCRFLPRSPLRGRTRRCRAPGPSSRDACRDR